MLVNTNIMVNKMLEEESKLERVGKHGGGRIYIPSNIVHDSQFPLEIGKEVAIKIDIKKNVVIISRMRKTEKR